jgi:hypothetical protein
LTRELTIGVWRWWLATGLAVTATLLLIAVPLMLRPHPAAANPGLQDRDYVGGLAIWLTVFWAGLLLGAILTSARRRPAAPETKAPADPGTKISAAIEPEASSDRLI